MRSVLPEAHLTARVRACPGGAGNGPRRDPRAGRGARPWPANRSWECYVQRWHAWPGVNHGQDFPAAGRYLGGLGGAPFTVISVPRPNEYPWAICSVPGLAARPARSSNTTSLKWGLQARNGMSLPEYSPRPRPRRTVPGGRCGRWPGRVTGKLRAESPSSGGVGLRARRRARDGGSAPRRPSSGRAMVDAWTLEPGLEGPVVDARCRGAAHPSPSSGGAVEAQVVPVAAGEAVCPWTGPRASTRVPRVPRHPTCALARRRHGGDRVVIDLNEGRRVDRRRARRTGSVLGTPPWNAPGPTFSSSHARGCGRVRSRQNARPGGAVPPHRCTSALSPPRSVPWSGRPAKAQSNGRLVRLAGVARRGAPPRSGPAGTSPKPVGGIIGPEPTGRRGHISDPRSVRAWAGAPARRQKRDRGS